MVRRRLRRNNQRNGRAPLAVGEYKANLLSFVAGGIHQRVGEGEGGERGFVLARGEAKFGANDVRGEAGTEQAAMQRGELALIERAAKVREMALEAGANG